MYKTVARKSISNKVNSTVYTLPNALVACIEASELNLLRRVAAVEVVTIQRYENKKTKVGLN